MENYFQIWLYSVDNDLAEKFTKSLRNLHLDKKTYTKKSDFELCQLTMDGDEQAFATLYKKYQHHVLAVIGRHVNSTSVQGTLSTSAEVLSKDVESVVWAIAHEALINKKFKPLFESSFKAYVARIASNKAIDLISRALKNRQDSYITKGTNTFPRFDDETQDVRDAIDINEQGQLDELLILEKLIPTLNSKELAVFELMKANSFLEQVNDLDVIPKRLTSVRMAEILEVNERTIRNRKRSIRDKARKISKQIIINA